MRKLVLGKVQLPKKISVLMREVTSLGKSWELQQLLSTNLNNSYYLKLADKVFPYIL